MGYNRKDYVRIKSEYTNKYLKARRAADLRREEIYEKLPEVKRIDVELSGTGREIMGVITSGKSGTEERISALRARNVQLLERRAEMLRAGGFPEDYSDIRYECEKCADSGYIDGKMCDCMKRALVLAGYESSGLGGLIRTQSFDNFSLDYYKDGGANYEDMRYNLNILKKFAEGFSADTYRNYLLLGRTGLGKTHLSTAVAKTVIDKGFDVFYVTAVSMMGDFENKRFGDGDEENRTERYYTADLLIIDDLGTELVNQFTLSCLYDVINSRINNRKCTFINTNLKKNEIEAKYSERITSRMFGEYVAVPFTGLDIRRQKIMK